MEVTGTQKEYSGVAQFRGTVSAIAYECIAFGVTHFTDLVHRPVFKSNTLFRGKDGLRPSH